MNFMTTELEEMMQNDSEQLLPNTYELTNVSDLAAHQIELENLIAKQTEILEDLTKRLRHVSESALPAAMAAIGMSEFKMSDGSKVSIKSDTYASIRADFVPQAVAWLDKNGIGGIVKDEVKVSFGRGETDKAKQMLLFAQDTLGVSASEKLSVHPGTLKATVKDMRTKGIEFPEEYFSIADITKATIKR